jgi:hypothetical protein
VVRLREAEVEEARALGELAFRSKAYWGHCREFMEACRQSRPAFPGRMLPVFIVALGTHAASKERA